MYDCVGELFILEAFRSLTFHTNMYTTNSLYVVNTRILIYKTLHKHSTHAGGETRQQYF